jgi:hypothetical protein
MRKLLFETPRVWAAHVSLWQKPDEARRLAADNLAHRYGLPHVIRLKLSGVVSSVLEVICSSELTTVNLAV